MIDWNECDAHVLRRISEIGHASLDILRGYRAISDAGTKTNRLDSKLRELISLAVAVIALCDGCIVAYTDAAFKHGATREEIVEALGVAVAVKAGAALLYSARVIDEVEAKGKSKFKPRKSEMYTRTIFDSSLSILIVPS